MIPSASLKDGTLMPLYGLGTWKGTGEEVHAAVIHAVKCGYRLVDTAFMYENEKEIGAAVATLIGDGVVERKDLFIVTKLNIETHGKEGTMASVQSSLEKLGTNYLDLVLIHTPRPGKIIETYGTLLELRKEGKIKNVGVSNFGEEHLKKLMEAFPSEADTPAVNQVEFHPWLRHNSMMSYCKSKGILVMAFCPLVRMKKIGAELAPLVTKSLGLTEPQLLLRWAVHAGTVTIPKSVSPQRIEENLAAITKEETEELKAALEKIDKMELEEFKASQACEGMTVPWDEVK
uniref:NADP-dependent oxidoreductase domain-containing protein n=1 Tax=Chromera velia CCMP2878 TaxID=1169474 RepID=A0A0G4HWZ2_9ALVE|eukprot:Cvel_9161.t1-p1 / transcript=Cvel_9161.t1 / gene=Cvel_9161 / organism=Chromera_velia_CCMP2878 / gene_product=Prostaglandin F synthase, putative / transcript_product=Prostaglandin F synthase, putative / location=Cvel_scaffold521:65817-66680(-) / protein_length=288 / sequence_SO=supercontig / SO=protein_coding / is_pseudo=false